VMAVAAMSGAAEPASRTIRFCSFEGALKVAASIRLAGGRRLERALKDLGCQIAGGWGACCTAGVRVIVAAAEDQ
jgi:hypothetical protein